MFRSSWAPARMALCWVRTEEGRSGHRVYMVFVLMPRVPGRLATCPPTFSMGR